MQREIITLTDKTTGTRLRGYKIGELCVVLTYSGLAKIYVISQRKPFLDSIFESVDDAVKIAEWLNNVFREFFILLDSYPDLDMIALTKWTVPNGIQIHETVRQLKITNEPVSTDTVSKLYQSAGSKVKEWTRQ